MNEFEISFFYISIPEYAYNPMPHPILILWIKDVYVGIIVISHSIRRH